MAGLSGSANARTTSKDDRMNSKIKSPRMMTSKNDNEMIFNEIVDQTSMHDDSSPLKISDNDIEMQQRDDGEADNKIDEYEKLTRMNGSLEYAARAWQDAMNNVQGISLQQLDLKYRNEPWVHNLYCWWMSTFWRKIVVRWLNIVNLVKILYEPAIITGASMPSISLWIEFLFVFIFAIDLAFCCFFYFNFGFEQNDKARKWQQIRLISLAFILFIHFITVIALLADSYETWNGIYTILRFCRVFYLFHLSKNLNNYLLSIGYSVIKLRDIFVFMILFWLVCTMIGFAFFYELNYIGENDYFSSFGESLWSLLVLQTTANFPDIMLENYDVTHYVALFFMVYNLVAIFGLMPIIQSLIYNNYVENKKENEFIVKNLKRSFDYYQESSKMRMEMQNESSCHWQSFDNFCVEVGKYDKRFAVSRTVRQQVYQVDICNENGYQALTKQQFLHLGETFERRNLTLNWYVQVKSQLEDDNNGYKKCKDFRIALLTWFVNPWSDIVMSLVIGISVIIVICDLFWFDSKLEVFPICNAIGLLFFLIDMILRIVAIRKHFFESLANIYNFVVTVLLLLSSILVFIAINTTLMSPNGALVIFLRAARFLTILLVLRGFTIKFLNEFLQFWYIIFNTVAEMFKLLFVVTYIYVLIGCLCFYGVISKDVVYDKCYVDDSNSDTHYWCDIYDNKYYNVNFNTVDGAFGTLMALIVVNNWHVITEMFVAASGNNAIYIYFIAVYCTVVLIGMNLVSASILNMFIDYWPKFKQDLIQGRKVSNDLIHKSAANVSIQQRRKSSAAAVAPMPPNDATNV